MTVEGLRFSWRCGILPLVLAVGLTACGGGDSETPPAGQAADSAQSVPEDEAEQPGTRGFRTPEGGRPGTLGTAEGTPVNVTITDGRIEVSPSTVESGSITVTVTNSDTQPHAIEVFHEHNGRWRTVRVPAGGTAQMSMAMASAQFEVYCPLDGHENREGMRATLRVR